MHFSWQKGHHQILRHSHAVGSAVFTPNTTLWVYRHTLLSSHCWGFLLPSQTAQDQKRNLPHRSQQHSDHKARPACPDSLSTGASGTHPVINDLLISTVINYLPSVKVNIWLALKYLKFFKKSIKRRGVLIRGSNSALSWWCYLSTAIRSHR